MGPKAKKPAAKGAARASTASQQGAKGGGGGGGGKRKRGDKNARSPKGLSPPGSQRASVSEEEMEEEEEEGEEPETLVNEAPAEEEVVTAKEEEEAGEDVLSVGYEEPVTEEVEIKDEGPKEVPTEPVGATVYQIEARYLVFNNMRVCGGVRVILNCQREEGYISLISLNNEIFVSFDVANLCFLESNSAAGASWCGYPVFFNQEGEGQTQEQQSSKSGAGVAHASEENQQRQKNKKDTGKRVEFAQVIFCSPDQMVRFRTVVETLRCALAFPDEKPVALTAAEAQCLNTAQQQTAGFAEPPVTLQRRDDPTMTMAAYQPGVPCYLQPVPAAGFMPGPGQMQPAIPPLGQPYQQPQHCSQFSPSQRFPASPSYAMADQSGGAQGFSGMYGQDLAGMSQNALQNTPVTFTDVAQPVRPSNAALYPPPTSPPRLADAQAFSCQQFQVNPNICQFQKSLGKRRSLDPCNWQPIKDPSPSPCNGSDNAGSLPYDPCPAGPVVANLPPCLPSDMGDPYSLSRNESRVLFCTPACLKIARSDDDPCPMICRGKLKIVECAAGLGFTIRLESATNQLLFGHTLRRNLVLGPTDEAEFGYHYVAVVCRQRKTSLEYVTLSFPSHYQMEQFHSAVDECKRLLCMTSARTMTR